MLFAHNFLEKPENIILYFTWKYICVYKVKKTYVSIFKFYWFLEREEGRKRETLICCSIHWLILVYGDNALSNWATWPGQDLWVLRFNFLLIFSFKGSSFVSSSYRTLWFWGTELKFSRFILWSLYFFCCWNVGLVTSEASRKSIYK